jgi:hypothetical protein
LFGGIDTQSIPLADPNGGLQALSGGLRAAALRARPAQLTSCRSFTGAGPAPKAAALIIGNEILSGSITDTNTPWLAKLLHRSASLPGSLLNTLSGAYTIIP